VTQPRMQGGAERSGNLRSAGHVVLF
jgi:hypothetical protein